KHTNPHLPRPNHNQSTNNPQRTWPVRRGSDVVSGVGGVGRVSSIVLASARAPVARIGHPRGCARLVARFAGRLPQVLRYEPQLAESAIMCAVEMVACTRAEQIPLVCVNRGTLRLTHAHSRRP
uniref:Uncharacterized protein n=1 Tax=Anopheles atroparvus TaxID=41427 RepID=A0AAG5DID9_ANOAO